MTPALASTWQFFLAEKQKSIQELTFLEGQKIGYKFPYYQPNEEVRSYDSISVRRDCHMMVRPRRFGVHLRSYYYMSCTSRCATSR